MVIAHWLTCGAHEVGLEGGLEGDGTKGCLQGQLPDDYGDTVNCCCCSSLLLSALEGDRPGVTANKALHII